MNGQGIAQFIPLILIFVIFYFFLIRPQQKRAKEHLEMVKGLKRGDEVITSGGIIGTINKVADNRELQVQVSENVEIKIAPGMVADLYTSTEIEKKQQVKETKTEAKGGLLSGLLGKKK